MKYLECGLMSKHYDYCNSILIKDVPTNMFFIKNLKSRKVYIKQKNDYDKSTKKYICNSYEDINSYCELKPNTIVYIDFTY